jgi:hypothetical protein
MYKKIYSYCTTLGFSISCTALEEKFLRDKKIKRSYFLYSFVFSRQKLFGKEWIDLSIDYLSKELGCSKSTIIRHSINLENKGYLLCKKNYGKNGFNRSNSYSVTLPDSIKKELEEQIYSKIDYDNSCEIYTYSNIKDCG